MLPPIGSWDDSYLVTWYSHSEHKVESAGGSAPYCITQQFSVYLRMNLNCIRSRGRQGIRFDVVYIGRGFEVLEKFAIGLKHINTDSTRRGIIVVNGRSPEP